MTYNRVARALHWSIAALAIANILIGIFHEGLGDILPVMPIHKAIGITVLALTIVRIVWRLNHSPPPLPIGMAAWERSAAHLTHATFYGLLLILPLTGWVMSSENDRPLTWFWLFDIPKFSVAKGDTIFSLSHGSHGVLGLLFGALVLIHVAAALRHHFVLRDSVLSRMLG